MNQIYIDQLRELNVKIKNLEVQREQILKLVKKYKPENQ